jgi:AcrR family transcriptional regulator
MSRNGARRDRHTDDTRRALLAAARDAFARDGYANTSLDTIVGRARLTKGALYHHFTSKAALLEALYVELEQELAAAVASAARGCRGGPWDRIVAALDMFFTASSEPAYVRIVLRDAPLVLDRIHGREIDQAIGVGLIVELLAALGSDGGLRPVPSAMTARVILAATSEVAMSMAYADDPERVRAEGTAVILTLLDGLRGAAPRPGAAAPGDASTPGSADHGDRDRSTPTPGSASTRGPLATGLRRDPV